MERKKVLVSEDDAYVVDFINYVLTESGLEVVVARDGKQVMELISKGIPDLMILDVMTPKLNGLQICKELGKAEKTRQIPKILMTASEKIEIDQEQQDSGVRFVIKKPFSANDLLKKVEELIAADTSR